MTRLARAATTDHVEPFPASSTSCSESGLPGTRWLLNISLVTVSLTIAQPPQLALSTGLQLAHAGFCCLSALVCATAGRAAKRSLMLRLGSKKTICRVFLGCRSGWGTLRNPKEATFTSKSKHRL